MGRDGITGLVMLAGSAFLYWATLPIQSNPLVPVSPAFYPRLVVGTTALLSAILLAKDIVAHRKGGAARTAAPAQYGMVAIMFAIFAAYVLALPGFGFRIATFAFVVAMQLALEPARTPRRWFVVLIVALAATLVTYYTFEQYLQVLLPRGRWTEF
ncbi:MAG TPA: tripartite tricarboxylate transporter TctB family protein [Usitatibacter sp.]|nr:tripartite tricarboxylate transporter TctB family protein [Usitatibacter sp.]